MRWPTVTRAFFEVAVEAAYEGDLAFSGLIFLITLGGFCIDLISLPLFVIGLLLRRVKL